MMLCVIMLAGLLPVTAKAVTTVSSVAITNVAAPGPGNPVPSLAITNTTGTEVYTVEWYDETGKKFVYAGSDYFQEGHIYTVRVWLEATSGYEFAYTNSYTPNVTATLNGKEAKVGKAYEYNAWAMVEVSYTFPILVKKDIQSLDITLPGVTKVGNVLRVEENSYITEELLSTSENVALDPNINLNRYYPNGFYWSNITAGTRAYRGERFKGGCDYYVTIAITPKTGGKFTSDLMVTINGKEATLKSKGDDYAEVGVELTCYGSITGLDVRPVVALPKDGNYPDTNPAYFDPQCKHIDYAAVTGWYDVETGKRLTTDDNFVGGKQYRVEMYCMAAYAYEFERDANDKMKYTPQITGWDVDSYSFDYDSYRGRELIYLSKTFTAETRDHICEGQWQSDETGHEKYCSTCGKALAGGAHWSNDEATCAQGKLCGVCGYEMTSPTENHTPDTKWTACGNLYHAHLCTVCGAHCDAQDHIPGPEATETTPQKCTVCAYVITPAKNHTHTPSAWRTTGTYHYKACTTCGTFLEQEDHKCGKATCKEAGKCTVCSYAYLEVTEKHTPDTKWTACSDLYHAHLCTVCGAHCDAQDHIPGPEATESTPQKCTVCAYVITPAKNHTHTPSAWRTTGTYHYKACTTCGTFLEQEDHKGGKATCKEAGKCSVCGYAYQEVLTTHIPGAAATETTAQTCTVCGYILQPAKNHTHDLTHVPYVAPTCLAAGTAEHYACSGCSTLFADATGEQALEISVIIPQLTHEMAEDWRWDENSHWRCCKLCNTLLDETKMAHEMEDGKCTTCGYGIGSVIPEPEATAPETTEPEATQSVPATQKPAQNNQQKKSHWLPIVLIILACVAVAGTVTVVIWKKKKK